MSSPSSPSPSEAHRPSFSTASSLVPSRRAVLGFGLGATLATAASRPAAALPKILLPKSHSEYETFPTLPVVRPQHVPTDEGLLFYVQHSINDNVIVYATRRTAEGAIDPDDPVDVFWRRYATAGHRRELNFFERTFAFGTTAQPLGGGRWRIDLVSFPGRQATFETGPDGKPRLMLDIDGQAMRPVYVYAEAIADGFIPTIVHVDIFAVAEGRKGFVRERLIFG